MKEKVNISEISAELLLGYLYPELTGQWMPRHAGTFYRNYNSDVMAVYENEPTVVLSRDGFLQLLPQGLLAGKSNEQMKVLKDAFLPIDAFWFNSKLQVELQVSQLLTAKLNYVLKQYFLFDLEAETDPYIRRAAMILPFVRSKRGDFAFIRGLVSTLAGCPVEMYVGQFSDVDTTVCAIPEVRYELFIPNLTAEEVNQKLQDLQPLFDFIREWLIPAEIECEFEMKDARPHTVDNTLILNYNTRLKA
ncbi:MAG: hypothetical protein J5884_00755 [Paludibacteraceae bacterium]|nr:hypothetical protein [Paludibacteraceae bacterium]